MVESGGFSVVGGVKEGVMKEVLGLRGPSLPCPSPTAATLNRYLVSGCSASTMYVYINDWDWSVTETFPASVQSTGDSRE